MKKKLPIGVANLREIITDNYLYVDKTREIHQLITQGGKYYFLSRPRRFGKSLLVSTLKELFSGNKELFKGLWIENKIEWNTHPVFYFDFSGLKFATSLEMEETLDFLITRNARENGILLTEKSYDKKFHELITEAAKTEKVVILIDEYDKPIIDLLHDPKQAALNRETLKTFYSVIKAMDEYIRFAFLTGVSKFSKVSVFSGLNNLRDITLSSDFALLLGYSQSELNHYFKEWIMASIEKMKISRQNLLARIREWYNGYSWNGTDFVYNPFSILNFFQENQFLNFWFTSGTPTFLVKLLRQNQKPYSEYEKYECGADIFDSFEIERINPVSLLFQTGYLTIKQARSISPGLQRFLLDYPNSEVKDSFLKHLLADVSQGYPDTVDNSIYQLLTALNAEDWDEFFSIFKSIFASIPYDIFIHQKEAYYHTVIYLVLALLGSHIQVEQHTSKGRMDGVLQTEKHIYILEFKLGTAADALAQIKNKGYAEKYQSHKKPITLIGIGFDPMQKNIADWQLEKLEIANF